MSHDQCLQVNAMVFSNYTMTSIYHRCIIFEQLTGKSFQMNKPGKAIAFPNSDPLEFAIVLDCILRKQLLNHGAIGNRPNLNPLKTLYFNGYRNRRSVIDLKESGLLPRKASCRLLIRYIHYSHPLTPMTNSHNLIQTGNVSSAKMNAKGNI